MIKVYVSANVNKANQKALMRSIDEIEAVCRRILISGCVPVAPSAWFARMSQDPRLNNSAVWWVENVYVCFMEDCDVFCYIPQLVGLSVKAVKAEKLLWKEKHPSKPVVPSDVIMNFLLEMQRNDIRAIC